MYCKSTMDVAFTFGLGIPLGIKRRCRHSAQDQMCVLCIQEAERPCLLRNSPQNTNQDTGLLFFIPGLSRHLGSPVKLISFFLHSALFVALSSFNPISVISLLHE